MMRCGSCSVAQLVAVLGVTGLGVGGYTYFSGDCSSCSDTTNATLVSTEGTHSCCGGEAKAALIAEGGCCSEGGDAGAVVLASETKDGESCCTSEAKVACKEGTDDCTGDGKDGCCGGCAEEKAAQDAEKVASSGNAPAGGGK